MMQQGRQIEPWIMDGRYMQIALELQAKRKAAGLSRSQMAALLGMKCVLYTDYERAQTTIPPKIMAQIDEILGKVKAGLLAIPIFNKEV
jgi:transcriptional regulator with XRE-family HTH domain